MGKGYYDHYLKKSNVPTIALAMREQIVTDFECDTFDIGVDEVITLD